MRLDELGKDDKDERLVAEDSGSKQNAEEKEEGNTRYTKQPAEPEVQLLLKLPNF